MPATTKKPIKIVPNTIKTIPKVPLSPISKSKSFQEKLNDIQNNIDINIDDIPEDLLDIWDELQEDITPKLISKNYKLWLTIFTPFILPGIINGMSGKPSVPQPVVTVQEPAPDPKQIVNFAQKYFAEHGLELCKSLTKTDLNNIKQDLINNWGKGPDAFSKAFQDSYPVSKARLENIYRSERHLAEYNGVLERAKIADHKYKQWRAVGDERSCDLCMSHDMETVPINEPFSNGEMTATGHPQCRCSMVTYSDEDYNEMKENSSYLADAFETIKLNYNCPDDEKIGSGPGSCSGGNTSNLDKVSTLKNKIRELEKSVSEGKSTFDEAYEQYKSIQKELDLELEKEKLRNPDNAKITNDIVTDPEPITPYKALSDYQNYAYTAINDYLRKTNHVKQNPQQTKNIQNMIKTIDSEMENNTLKSDKLVFRADSAGISSDAFEKTGLTNIFKDTFGKESLTLEDFIKNHKLIDKIREKLVGYEYTEKAYLSTGSDKENTMNRFLAPSRNISKYGVTGLINLIVPKGTPAIRIADYTGLEDELGGKIDEYLIGRDQTIVIDQVYIRPADDNRLYLEYNAHIKTNEQKQNSEYLEDVSNFIKLNYKCPKGTVDDSNKCDIEKPIVNIPIPNKFKDIDNVKSDKIRGESSEFLNQLVQNNEYLVNSLKSYTNIGHLEVNKYLGNRISGNIPKEIEKIITGLDSIFNLQKEQNFLTSSSITTYRGVSDIEIENLLGLNQKHIDDIEPGKIIIDPKFVSTTLNKEQALQFGRDRYGGSIITILIPKNSEALHTESVSGSEDELLINRNQSYKFLGVNKNIDNSGLDSNKPVHEFIFELVNANQKQSSSYLSDAVETIKLNYNCPDSEKNGSGPGSCGGSNTSSNKPKNDIVSLKEEQKAIKRILLDYNRLSQPKDDSYNQLSNRLKEINKTLDIETPKSVSVDITAPSRSALEKMIQGDPTFDDDPLPWDEDYNVKLGGTLYQIRLEGWYDDCLESRGYDKIDPDKYQDVIQSDFKQIVSDESGWGNSKENIYGYVPNVPGTTYGVTYIGRPIKTKQNSEYLEDATDFIKLNYKCPKGTVDDSNKCNPEEQEKSNTSDSKSASETFIGFKADHDFSSPQDRSAKHVKITTIKAIV